ncbi:hypothetical protein ACJX0J_030656 [Zea mays]
MSLSAEDQQQFKDYMRQQQEEISKTDSRSKGMRDIMTLVMKMGTWEIAPSPTMLVLGGTLLLPSLSLRLKDFLHLMPRTKGKRINPIATGLICDVESNKNFTTFMESTQIETGTIDQLRIGLTYFKLDHY